MALVSLVVMTGDPYQALEELRGPLTVDPVSASRATRSGRGAVGGDGVGAAVAVHHDGGDFPFAVQFAFNAQVAPSGADRGRFEHQPQASSGSANPRDALVNEELMRTCHPAWPSRANRSAVSASRAPSRARPHRSCRSREELDPDLEAVAGAEGRRGRSRDRDGPDG